MREIPIAICGLGAVGSAVVNLLNQHKSLIADRYGFVPKLVQVGVRSSKPKCDLGDAEQHTDIFKLATDPRCQILIELIGGVDDAYELTMQALRNKKHVITANKALLAVKGDELFATARDNGVGYFYEASVAGGIPIIKVIKEGLAANQISRIVGIINGTCNYILTEMMHKEVSFATALKQAQELGYAEADPRFDIDGSDSAHKISILGSLAFGMPLSPVYQEGIEQVEIDDIKWADELGYAIKHLAVAEMQDKNVSLMVHPTLVHHSEPIAAVNGVINAVMIDSTPLGRSFYSGAGAGGDATASAVVADLIDAVSYQAATNDSATNQQENRLKLADLSTSFSEFYLRMHLEDKTGVMAQVTEILSESDISIEGLIQKDSSDNTNAAKQQVPVIIITHKVTEKSIDAAIERLQQLPQVKYPVVKLRILPLAT